MLPIVRLEGSRAPSRIFRLGRKHRQVQAVQASAMSALLAYVTKQICRPKRSKSISKHQFSDLRSLSSPLLDPQEQHRAFNAASSPDRRPVNRKLWYNSPRVLLPVSRSFIGARACSDHANWMLRKLTNDGIVFVDHSSVSIISNLRKFDDTSSAGNFLSAPALAAPVPQE